MGSLAVDKGGNTYSCTVWDAITGKKLRALPFSHVIHALAFSPDGEKLAIAGGGGAYSEEKTKTCLWAFAADKVLVKYPDHDEGVVKLAFIGDGNTLASVTGKSLRLLDVGSKKQRAKFALPKETFAAAFSADYKIVVTSKWSDEMLFIREVATGKIISAINVKDTLGSVFVLSPDARFWRRRNGTVYNAERL